MTDEEFLKQFRDEYEAEAKQVPNWVFDYAASLGMVFGHVVTVPNNPDLREAATWVPMLSLLNPDKASGNEVVFSAHAKGVRHPELNPQLKAWAEVMYQQCLDDWERVESQLARFLMTGCFKHYGNFSTAGNDCWHYSGTFFWWRLAEIGKRNWSNVEQTWYGTEAWPGLQCKREGTGCLFMDGTQNLYEEQYWKMKVWPALAKQKATVNA